MGRFPAEFCDVYCVAIYYHISVVAGWALRGELKVCGPFSRAGSFGAGGGNEATPGPLSPSQGRLGYTSIRSRFSL
jgi:hypothetical protein